MKKKMNKIREYLSVIPFLLIGGICGFLFPFFADEIGMENLTYLQRMVGLLLELLAIYIVLFIHLIIHEFGHLIFGIMSGYHFCGGHCRLSPPDMKDGRIPFVLYNMGGSILNIVVSIVFAVIAWFGRANGILFVISGMFCIVGLGISLMNVIPFRFGRINNDGYNAISLGKSPVALRSFWVQLKVKELLTSGVRLKDMPQEWFFMPEDAELQNSIVGTMAVIYAKYQLDQHHFAETKECIDKLLKSEAAIVPYHINLLICDRIFCELIEETNPSIVQQLLTKEQKKFMKQKRKYPSVIRTEFAIALLLNRDTEKAEKKKINFNRCVKKYSYESNMEGERELMEIACNIHTS